MPPIDELDEGVNVINADPDYGMDLAYVSNGDVIYVQTRVGPLLPDIVRESDPTLPARETDVRYVDALGNTFLVQLGGDEFIDRQWGIEFKSSDVGGVVDGPLRARSFELAEELGTKLDDTVVPAALRAHAVPLANLSATLADNKERLATRAAQLIDERPVNTYSAPGWQYHLVDSYVHSVLVFWDHAAVIAWNWSNNQQAWTQAIVTCNHGGCGGGGSYYCTTHGGWRYQQTVSDYFSSEPSSSTGTVSGACLTPYDWSPDSGEHNSNNDAAYQIWQVKNGQSGSPYTWYANFPNGRYSCNDNGNNEDFTKPSCL